MIYVIRADNPSDPNDRGTPTRVSLVGPFGNAEDAGSFFRTIGPSPKFETLSNPNNPHDNPMWQVVDLSSPSITICSPADYKPTGSF